MIKNFNYTAEEVQEQFDELDYNKKIADPGKTSESGDPNALEASKEIRALEKERDELLKEKESGKHLMKVRDINQRIIELKKKHGIK